MKRLLFVDDEQLVLDGLRRMLAPKRRDWDMRFVNSAAKALDALDAESFDLVVSDLRMPEMNGHQLLTLVKEKQPEVIRVILTGQPDRDYEQDGVFPAHQYLTKPCDYKSLVSVLENALSLEGIEVDERMRRIVSRMESTPALPEIHQALAEELDQPEPSMDRVTELVARDVGVSARLLTLVNSPYYGHGQAILDLRYTVMLLGFDVLRTLVIAVHAFSLFDQTRIKGFSLPMLWEHSLRTASFAKRLALLEKLGAEAADAAFASGLLHDLGKLILAVNFPAEYETALELVRAGETTVAEAEKSVLGATHAEIGAYLLGLWGIAPIVVKAAAMHHHPEAQSAELSSPLLTFAANILDHKHVVINERRRRPEGFPERLASLGLESKTRTWDAACLELLKELGT